MTLWRFPSRNKNRKVQSMTAAAAPAAAAATEKEEVSTGEQSETSDNNIDINNNNNNNNNRTEEPSSPPSPSPTTSSSRNSLNHPDDARDEHGPDQCDHLSRHHPQQQAPAQLESSSGSSSSRSEEGEEEAVAVAELADADMASVLLLEQVKQLRDELEEADRKNYDLQVENSAKQRVIDELTDMVRGRIIPEQLQILQDENEGLKGEIVKLRDTIENLEDHGEDRENKIQALEQAFMEINNNNNNNCYDADEEHEEEQQEEEAVGPYSPPHCSNYHRDDYENNYNYCNDQTPRTKNFRRCSPSSVLQPVDDDGDHVNDYYDDENDAGGRRDVDAFDPFVVVDENSNNRVEDDDIIATGQRDVAFDPFEENDYCCQHHGGLSCTQVEI